MKKNIGLLASVTVVFTLLMGCSSYNDKAKETSQTTTAVASQASVSADWTPSSYKEINNFEGVSMTVKKGTVSAKELSLVFKNESSSQCIYGEFFCLEKEMAGAWYQVPVTIKGNYGFTSIGYNLSSGDENERTINWEWLYGSLDAGKYRIVKDISDFRGTGDYDTYYLAAEFTLE